MTFFGAQGTNHIGSEDFAALLDTIYDGSYRFGTGGELAVTMIDANTASVAKGAAVLQGYFYHHETVDTLAVESGTSGYKRNDLVVMTYTLGTDEDDNAVQDVYLRVIKGTATVGEPSDPAYSSGSISGGDVLVDFPLARLSYNGVNTPTVTMLMGKSQPLQSLIHANDTAIGQLRDSVSRIGTVLTGSWTATSTSAAGASLTSEVSLQAGTYLIVISTAKMSVSADVGLQISNVGAMGYMTVPQNGFASGAWFVTVNATRSARAIVGTSQSVTYSDTGYGKIQAIRIA